ncbi:MAG: DNA helicase RecQ [Cyclobacteriaceae bacterium]
MQQQVSSAKLIQTLETHFGYTAYRKNQDQIIKTILAGQDSLVLMPTGGGKSLCYQIPALLLEGVTVVVSPLISLMKDQVDALRVNGIAAAYLNSSLSSDEQTHVFRQLKNGELKLLYLAPERLVGSESRFVEFLKSINTSLLAIDEAHCISQWGHDFRPEYRMLAEVRVALDNVPTVALTATADPITQKDILDKLQLRQPKVFISSFNRENIHYRVAPKRHSYDQLIDFLSERRDQSGIIYVLSRASAESLAERLTQEGFQAKPYHAKLERTMKEQNQEEFLRDEVPIIVATVAFGMGINKSNVRFVVHMDLPKNIEGYYQETGRAGRDGLKSEALLFYSYADVIKLKGFVEVEGNEAQSRILQEKLQQMATFSDLRTCRRKFLLNYFGEEAPDYCGNCDVCLNEYKTFDGTVLAQKALSAVARLEERFGVSYVIDFLRGSQSEKIWDQHKQLKTYGAGADISKKDWHRYFNDLLQLEYLQKSDGKFPILQLTEKSWSVLKGEEKVMMVEAVETQEATTQTTDEPIEDALISQLKTLRRQLAQQENVPAYVIFSDATLQELATYLPTQAEDLSRISGFGEVKINKYGEAFLEEINQYCIENDLESRMSKLRRKSRKKRAADKKTDTKQATYDYYRQGKSVEEIARMRGLQTSTICSHLSYYVQSGALDVTELVDPVTVSKIEDAIYIHGDTSLKPLKDALDNHITYDEIRLVIGHCRR